MKIYAYLAGLLLLAGFVGGAVHLWRKAERVDVAEANEKAADKRAAAADLRAVDTAERFLAAATTDRKNAAELDGLRAEMAKQNLYIAQLLKEKPLTHEVTHVDAKTGATVTCRERDAARYLELWNSAADGTAAPANSGGLF